MESTGKEIMDIALLLFYIACLTLTGCVSGWVKYGDLTQQYLGWLGWAVASFFVFILVLQQYNETKTDRPSYANLSALIDKCQENAHQSQVTLYQCAYNYNQCIDEKIP